VKSALGEERGLRWEGFKPGGKGEQVVDGESRNRWVRS